MSKNKGSLTGGPDSLTIEDLTKRKIEEIRKVTLKGNYQWVGIRRINIPKPSSAKTRPLGIPSINDRLVQEVLRIIIEPIFETQFLETSHGFRPERSCHVALKDLNTRFKACR